MNERPAGRVLGGGESVAMTEPSGGVDDGADVTGAVQARDEADDYPTAPVPPWRLRLLGAATGLAIALCLALSVVHVLLVFLHVAPSNTISRHYRAEINTWIYPYFEQDWRLFAPEPQSVTRQISVRTVQSSPGGAPQVSNWFDLTAVDNAAVEHNFFPSHTNQNMLRRAWDAYLDLYGSGDQPRSERALMMQKYLRNIAVDRLTTHRPGTYEAIQLRVITRPIAAPGTAGNPQPTSADTRYLPWWKVEPNGD